MPLTWLSPLGGEGDTSCRRPFPGRPGLSQPCFRRRLSGHRAATVLSRNDDDSARAARDLKPLFSTTSSLSGSVNNLGITSLTGCSHVRADTTSARPLPRDRPECLRFSVTHPVPRAQFSF